MNFLYRYFPPSISNVFNLLLLLVFGGSDLVHLDTYAVESCYMYVCTSLLQIYVLNHLLIENQDKLTSLALFN